MASVEKKKQIVSYVESSSDQASVMSQNLSKGQGVDNLYSPFNIGKDNVYLDQVRPKEGERIFPGEGLQDSESSNVSQQGFLWADTPEASVFVRKKQWRDEGWNFGIPKGREEDAVFKSNRDFDLQVREIAGRIITRKLEWINDHEQFSKSSVALRTFLSEVKIPKFAKNEYKVTNDKGERFDSVVSKVMISIYGEKNFKDMSVKEKNVAIDKFTTENEDVIFQAVLQYASDNNQPLPTKVEYENQSLSFQKNLLISKGTVFYYDYISETITNLVTPDTSGYISPSGDLTAAGRELLLNLYAPTSMSDGAFTRYFQTTAKVTVEGEEKLKTVFNGVMEFANISNISVSRVLNGDCTASLTFENPGNIMMISRTDIEMGLSEFATKNEIPASWDKSVEGLVFYRGRYYTETMRKQLAFSYSDLAVSSTTSALAPEFSKTFEAIKSTNRSYKVEAEGGETLQQIAIACGCYVEDILRLNPEIKKEYDRANSDTKKTKEAPNIPRTAAKTSTKIQTASNSLSFLLKKGEMIQVPSKKVVNETDDQKSVRLREKLEKFFLNRYIVEPLDHVWIWMTSPSKSLFVLENGQKVVEAPDSAIALKLQMDKLDQQITAKNEEKMQLKTQVDVAKDITTKEQLNRQIKATDIEIASLQKRRDSLKAAIKAYNLARSTDSVFANRTRDLTANDPQEQSLKGTLIGNEQLENLSSEVQGMSEQQFQVFEGVILDVTESYSDGKYTLSAKCKDLMYYLEASRIMSKPGLQGSGTLDPTYEVNTPIIEKGENAGLWKSGMLVRAVTDDPKEVDANPGLLIAAQQFAKTDAANVISFLILGIPYNIGLFVKNALEDGRVSVSEAQQPQVVDSNTSATKDPKKFLGGYFGVIREQLGLQNELLGNFKPFTFFGNQAQVLIENKKEITDDITALVNTVIPRILGDDKGKQPKPINDEVLKKLIKKYTDIETIDGNGLSKTIIAEFLDEKRETSFLTDDDWKKKLKLKAAPVLNNQAYKALNLLYTKRATLAAMTALGDAYDKLGGIKDTERDSLSTFLMGTTKQKEDIVANRDVNYLMISSEYKMNTSLDAFNYELGGAGWNLWQSEFEMPLQTCKKAAEVINWEFYIDENGNLRFESSKYNRILREHLPRLFARALVKNPDGTIADPLGQKLKEKFWINQNEQIERFVADLETYRLLSVEFGKLRNQLGAVAFYEREVTIGEQSWESLDASIKDLEAKIKVLENWMPKFQVTLAQDVPNLIRQGFVNDLVRSPNNFYAPAFDRIVGQIEAKKVLSEAQDWLVSPDLSERVVSDLQILKANFLEIQKVENEFRENIVFHWTKEQIFANMDAFIANEVKYQELVSNPNVSGSGYLNIMKQMDITYKQDLKEAQDAFVTVTASLKVNQQKVVDNKATEEKYFETQQAIYDLENSIDQFKLDIDKLSPDLAEMSDDARIHRISDSIVIGSTYRESKPTYTRLDVNGQPSLVDLRAAQSTYYLSAGVDFDLWRTYGYIFNQVDVPYFDDAAKCKPYNEILLGRQWGLIFSAELTVRGDSKYRLNDTVYIESRDMYFRVAGVSHSFVYGSSYQTSLTLDYGRRPEFIIPDPWDLLGKITIDSANNADNGSTPTMQEKKAAEVAKVARSEATAKDVVDEEQKVQGIGTSTIGSTSNQVDSVKKEEPQPPSTEAKQVQKEVEVREGVLKATDEIHALQKKYWDLENQVSDLESQIADSEMKEAALVKEKITPPITPEKETAFNEQINAEGRKRKELQATLKQVNDDMAALDKQYQEKNQVIRQAPPVGYNYKAFKEHVWN